MAGGMAKSLGEMAFNRGAINWFPGHMAAATRAIKERLKLADLVLEVRDARIPLSSANADLQNVLSQKRRIVVLNKRDLANSNMIHKWTGHFDQHKQCSYFAHAHSKNNISKLLVQVQAQLKEPISRQPTLLVMVIGIPNVGKSALINSLHQISRIRFPAQEKLKRATVGPLPGVTQDIAGFKIALRPSIYVLDTPGILVPNIPDIDTGLKLALTGAIKDSVVGEDRVAQYLLATLNTRQIPLHWKDLDGKGHGDYAQICLEDLTGNGSEVPLHAKKKQKNVKGHSVNYTEDHTVEVQKALFRTFSGFEGNLENEDDLEHLIETQFTALQKAFRMSPDSWWWWWWDGVFQTSPSPRGILILGNFKLLEGGACPHGTLQIISLLDQYVANDKDHTVEVQKALFRTFSGFEGNLENEDDLEHLIETQFTALQKAFRIPPNSGEVGRNKVSRKLLHLFRIGKLGHYILDSIPNATLSR